MYIGTTGPMGISHMVLEILENSIDLVLGGRASTIDVVCHEDRSFEIRDNGPGLNLADEAVRSFFEIGHDNATADGHQPHVHLWEVGLGLFAINALCERLTVESVHNGMRYSHEWTMGGDQSRVLATSTESEEDTFTSIRFWPDCSIFGESVARPEDLAHRLTELERLIPELQRLTFSYQTATGADGLTALMQERQRLTSGEIWRHTTSIETGDSEPIEVDLAMSANHVGSDRRFRFDEQMLIFCNFKEVTEESGVQRAVRSSLQAPESQPLKGLAMVCNLRMLSPQFSGPTRGRVDDPLAMAAVSKAVVELLEAHPLAQSAVNELLKS